MAATTNGHSNGNGTSDGGELAHFVNPLTTLEEDAREFARSRRELLNAAADAGLHPQALCEVVKLRLQTRRQAEKREQYREKLDEYLAALGVHADPPAQPERRQRVARA